MKKEDIIILEKAGMTKGEFLQTLAGIKDFINETFGLNFCLVLFDVKDHKLVSLYSDTEINAQISVFKHILHRFEKCFSCSERETCQAFKMQNMNIKKKCDNKGFNYGKNGS